ncbi:MAG: ApaLI family restriction endonuclease [Armatimonadetes bacterium]|nr:ApaLI family restriction endonuclease [Armatimonadota bacterium]
MNTPPLPPNKVEQDIRDLATRYAKGLQKSIAARVADMESDDNSHYLIYRVLGVSDEEGKLIDLYQNKGRFLYQYAGAFLERAAKLCFIERFPEAASFRIPNPFGQRPQTFVIDLLIENRDALEIKWRDATTDGDHIIKEHARIRAVAGAGYKPVRIMFYYPNRDQAIRIQQTLETLYAGVHGEYYHSDEAWDYVKAYTAVDLKAVLQSVAKENMEKWQRSEP